MCAVAILSLYYSRGSYFDMSPNCQVYLIENNLELLLLRSQLDSTHPQQRVPTFACNTRWGFPRLGNRPTHFQMMGWKITPRRHTGLL